MIKVGEIGLELIIDKKKYNIEINRLPAEASKAGTKISNALSKSANSCGDKITSAFGKIGKTIAAAFSVKIITEFTKKMVQAAAAVQAADSQLEQTFGDMFGAATAAMKKVADESGIVETRLQGVGTSIYAFARTTGMDSVTALNMMQEALQVTADSAAYYDRSLEDVSESLKSFLKGNYANDAALGLSCTETTRNTAANKLYGKSFKDLSESQKQLTLLQMVKDANEASGALGQAARESDGLENVLGNLKEAWNQLLAVVGKPGLNGAVSVIKKVTEWLQKMTTYAKAAVSALSELFGWETENTAAGAQATSDAISSAVDNQEDLTEEVKNTNEEVKRGVASFDRLNVISETSSSDDDSDSSSSSSSNSSGSLGVADTISTELEIDTSSASTEIDKIKSKLSKIFNPVKDAYNKYIKPIGDKIKNTFDKLKGVWEEWREDLNLEPLRESIELILSKLDPLVDAILPQIEYIYENVILPISKKVAEEILPTILNLLGRIIGFIIPIIDKIGGVLQPIWENILRPALEKISEWFAKIGDKIGPKIEEIGGKIGELLEKLGPLVDLISQVIGPAIEQIIDSLGGGLADGLSNLIDTIGSIVDALGGLADFLTGVFTGDWEKAWLGMADFLLGIINFVIDILNSLWISIYSTISLIVNAVGGLVKGLGQLLGNDNWGWEMSSEAPLIQHLEISKEIKSSSGGVSAGAGSKIPHMATGRIVKAPTLALVGDNPGAGSGDPEVVAPLSKLNGMINTGGEADTTLLTQILNILNKIYEQFIIFKNNGGSSYQFVATLEGEVIFNEFVRQVNLYKQRHHGKEPWD